MTEVMVDFVRYVFLQRDCRYLYRNKGDFADRFEVEPVRSAENLFVDILEVDGDWANLRLHYPSGKIVTGWCAHWFGMRPVEIIGMDNLYDGRFNSDQ